jgi:Arc/MetJ-type ribon-helix-helix transcriptional regulator
LTKNGNRTKAEILLVEFKAPRELLEAFDDKLKPKFSSRSEAIRSLIRTFLEASSRELESWKLGKMSHPLRSWGDYWVEGLEGVEKKQFIDEFKSQWKSMWLNRVDDRVRAEGIADKDYSLLFVDRGTVIVATRKFKHLDFYELLQQQKLSLGNQGLSTNPSVGGWGRFIRTAFVSRNVTRRGRSVPSKPDVHFGQQLKKGGRGWLHSKE